MLIGLTILSLLEMPFLLNLTDSLTFNCVFLLIIQLFQKRLSERLANVERRLHDRKELWLRYLICKIS